MAFRIVQSYTFPSGRSRFYNRLSIYSVRRSRAGDRDHKSYGGVTAMPIPCDGMKGSEPGYEAALHLWRIPFGGHQLKTLRRPG